MSGEAIDALERWHATTRALREAKPGTAEFVRLRMVAQEQRVEYEALVDREDARRNGGSQHAAQPERSAAR